MEFTWDSSSSEASQENSPTSFSCQPNAQDQVKISTEPLRFMNAIIGSDGSIEVCMESWDFWVKYVTIESPKRPKSVFYAHVLTCERRGIVDLLPNDSRLLEYLTTEQINLLPTELMGRKMKFKWESARGWGPQPKEEYTVATYEGPPLSQDLLSKPGQACQRK